MSTSDKQAAQVEDIASVCSFEDVPQHDVSFNNVEVDYQTRKKLFWSWASPRKSRQKRPFFVWYPANSTLWEKKVIFKLDCFVLTFVCLSFFIKYLDSSNVSNAYVSGMQEAYDMKDADYNWLDNAFHITYSVFGLLGPLLMTRFSPGLVFPLFELGWSIACILVIATKSYGTLMVVRSIQGALEGIAFPSIFYILGTLYSPDILVSRSAVFIMSGCVGPLVGGLLQARLVSIDGAGGLAAWKWPFVIDFCISVPVAIFGYLILPDDPAKGKPNFYLNAEELEYIHRQTQAVKDVENTNKFNWGLIKRALCSWQFYVFTIAYTISQMTEAAGGYWSIVLESQGYDIYDRNNIPSIQAGVKAVTSLFIGFICDWRGRYCEAYAVLIVLWISGLAILVQWDVPRAAEFYAYSIIGVCAPVSVVVVSWCNEMTREDAQVRAFTLGSLNLVCSFATTPMGIMLFNTKYAPQFASGMKVALGIACAQFFYNGLMVWFDRYQNRVRDHIEDVVHQQKVTCVIAEEITGSESEVKA
ncbi:Pantothenate transporter FEN2 [Cyberlindnera fabianii]|uniref:Pantothenate transporter FEN2 n=1 Tax=Cyberlindnera fabianii TaxID=36022 RepID=A0A1V2L3B4_CYBFA|nr:Pantothenate transporter FEN2 [Cyberlindnera fabianii]